MGPLQTQASLHQLQLIWCHNVFTIRTFSNQPYQVVRALVHVTTLVATSVTGDLGGLNLPSPEHFCEVVNSLWSFGPSHLESLYLVHGTFALANLRTWYFNSITAELMKCICKFISFSSFPWFFRPDYTLGVRVNRRIFIIFPYSIAPPGPVCVKTVITYGIIQLCRGPMGLIPGVGQRSSRFQTRISGRDAFLTYLQFCLNNLFFQMYRVLTLQ